MGERRGRGLGGGEEGEYRWGGERKRDKGTRREVEQGGWGKETK